MDKRKVWVSIESLIAVGPILWVWLPLTYFSIIYPSPMSLIIIVPGLFGLYGYGMLFHAVVNYKPLNFPYFIFFMVGAGCTLCFGLIIGDGSYFNFVNILFIMPIVASGHLSWLYHRNTNKPLKQDK